MDDLRSLYQELILDHNKNPRNRGAIADAGHEAKGYNPLCGDRVTIYLRVVDGVVQEASFDGSGCAISTASASLMTESVKGKPIEEARAMFERFHGMITGQCTPDIAEMGKLAVFSGVGRFPARVKCATLAWHTMCAALEGQDDPVTTE